MCSLHEINFFTYAIAFSSCFESSLSLQNKNELRIKMKFLGESDGSFTRINETVIDEYDIAFEIEFKNRINKTLVLYGWRFVTSSI